MWNEIILWSLISGFGQSINLMTIFYNYLIASHPTIVLCMYLFLYCCFAKYVFDLGGLSNEFDNYDMNKVEFVGAKPSSVPTENNEQV